MKNERQNAIANLILTHSIEKQEDLIRLLKEAGFDAAQATVSRDLRQMNVIKIGDGAGRMKYSLPQEEPENKAGSFSSVFAAAVISVDYSMNNVVIKTSTGLANAVAVGLDKSELSGILGCVAGDDTIIIVTRTAEDSAALAASLNNLISSKS